MHDYMYNINDIIYKAQQNRSKAVEMYASVLDDLLSTAEMTPTMQVFVDKTIEALYDVLEEMEEEY